MEKNNSNKKPKVFYGYWIVLATFLIMVIQSGSTFYAFSLFVKSLQENFGWNRGEIMAGLTIFFLIGAIASPYAGRLVDRYSAKWVLCFGSIIFGTGFALLCWTNALWYLYLGWTIVGIGGAAIGAIPLSAIVSNWFKKHRGTAIGVMAVGVGAGGLVMAPIIGSWLIPTIGWRASYLTLAIVAWVVIIPLSLLVVKTKPAEIGLFPDGAKLDEAIVEAKGLPVRGISLKIALGTSAFWLVAVSYLTSAFSQLGIAQNSVPHLEDIGFPVTSAAAAFAGMGLGSAVGKFTFGWLCDFIPAKYASAIGLVLQAAGIAIFITVGPTSSLLPIWLYALIFGFGMGSWLPTLSMLISTNFGMASYGAVFGMVSLIQGIGSSTGPLVIGHMYDVMKTYHIAFIILLVLYAIAIPAILMVRRPK